MGLLTTLPGGFWHQERCYGEAEIRFLNGADESTLVEEGRALPPALRTTAILARCLERLGPIRQVTAEEVRSLTVGDREALLLELRRMAFGDRMDCVLDCPRPDCRQPMDLELKVGDLRLPPSHNRKKEYEVNVACNGTSLLVRFRLPTGADQEIVVEEAGHNPEAAAQLLLERCVKRVTGGNGELVRTDWPQALASEVAARMAQLDPQAELRLELCCPVCGHGFSTVFDAGTFFFQELEARCLDLYGEVHTLALHYHWSESDILALPAGKRELYLQLLQQELGGGAPP